MSSCRPARHPGGAGCRWRSWRWKRPWPADPAEALGDSERRQRPGERFRETQGGRGRRSLTALLHHSSDGAHLSGCAGQFPRATGAPFHVPYAAILQRQGVGQAGWGRGAGSGGAEPRSINARFMQPSVAYSRGSMRAGRGRTTRRRTALPGPRSAAEPARCTCP